MEGVTVRVLGGVEAAVDGVPVPLPARMHRALLAVLALDAGRTVPVATLVDALWGDDPPASAVVTLQGYVAALRRALEPGRAPRSPARVVVTRGAGYALDVPPDAVDALAFEADARAGADALAAGSPAVALARLESALDRWSGAPAPEVAGSVEIEPARARLAELHAAAAEDHADALLRLGRTAAAVAELEQLVAAAPLRERRQALLARALAVAGRQGDALDVLRRARARLAEELGLDPSSVLRETETAVLRQAVEPTPDVPPAVPPAVHSAAAERLRVRLDALLGARRGGVVVVAGESGTGKTVLVDRMSADAERGGALVLRATCPDAGTAPGFWPLRRLLRDLSGPGGDAARAALQGAASRSGSDGAHAEFLAYDAVAAALQEAAARGPVLLVLDDTHAVDASTGAVLGLLAPDLARLGALAVLVLREPLPPPALPLAGLSAFGERVDVGLLDPAELAALGAAVLGAPPDPQLLARVAERSGGLAFLAAELFRARDRETLPGTVLAWTAARIARLPEHARTVLALAALAGTDVDLGLLARATGADAATVARDLDRAATAGLLVAVPSTPRLRFAHGLVRDAVAAGLAPGERSALHLALADALPPSAAPAAAVTHLLAAGELVPAARVVEATRAAASAAVRGGAWAEAAAALQRSVEALRARADGGAAAWELLLELGAVRRGVGDTVGAYAAFDEALALAPRYGDEARLRAAAAAYGAVALWSSRPVGGHDADLVAVLDRAASSSAAAGDAAGEIAVRGALACELAYSDRPAAAAHADRAVRLARRLGDPGVLVRALHHAWRANVVPWLAAEQLARDDEAIALLGTGGSPLVELVLRLQRVMDLATLGRLDELDRELTTCRLLRSEVRSPELAAQVGYTEAGLAMLRGQWDHAAAAALRATEEIARTSRPDAGWSHLAGRWGVLHAQGRSGEMADELVAVSAEPGYASLRAAAAVAVLDAGDEAAARDLAARWFEPPREDWTWMTRMASWAELSARIGTPDPAVLRDLLLPCSGLLAVSGSLLDCGGSVDALLAGLSLRLGDTAEGRRFALAAQRQESALGLRAWQTRTAALVAATAVR